MDKDGIIIYDKGEEEIRDFNKKVNKELRIAYELYYDEERKKEQWPFLKLKVGHAALLFSYRLRLCQFFMIIL